MMTLLLYVQYEYLLCIYFLILLSNLLYLLLHCYRQYVDSYSTMIDAGRIRRILTVKQNFPYYLTHDYPRDRGYCRLSLCSCSGPLLHVSLVGCGVRRDSDESRLSVLQS